MFARARKSLARSGHLSMNWVLSTSMSLGLISPSPSWSKSWKQNFSYSRGPLLIMFDLIEDKYTVKLSGSMFATCRAVTIFSAMIFEYF